MPGRGELAFCPEADVQEVAEDRPEEDLPVDVVDRVVADEGVTSSMDRERLRRSVCINIVIRHRWDLRVGNATGQTDFIDAYLIW